MIETDVQSRTRLLFLGGFFILLFGGFALSGLVQRLTERTDSDLPTIKPVPMTAAQRKQRQAERKLEATTVKKISLLGRTEKWEAAITTADAYLAHNEKTSIRLYRDEALIHLGRSAGWMEMAKVLSSNYQYQRSDMALLQGDDTTYRNDRADLLATIDESKVNRLDANNAAWWYAMGADQSDKAGIAKAVRLSEYAVNDARTHEDTESIPTYTNTLGAIYLRAGRDQDALAAITESERLHHDPFNYPFFALAQWGMGNKKEAIGWRDRLRQYVTDTYATPNGQNSRHELLLLWRETEQTIR